MESFAEQKICAIVDGIAQIVRGPKEIEHPIKLAGRHRVRGKVCNGGVARGQPVERLSRGNREAIVDLAKRVV